MSGGIFPKLGRFILACLTVKTSKYIQKKNMKFIKENNLFYDYLIYPIILSELKINKKTKIIAS